MDLVVVLIKPGFPGIAQEASDLIEQMGYAILGQKRVIFDSELIAQFWPEQSEHWGKLLDYLGGQETLALLVLGERTLDVFREFKERVSREAGLTNPKDAIHSSDCAAIAERELQVIFGDQSGK